MPAVQSVLVVGAGAAGATAAILLAQAGVAVEVVEVKPEVGALGSGITLQGNALRVLKQVGVWDAVSAAGYPYDTVALRAPDPQGSLIVEMTDARTGGPELPAGMGMHRPTLAQILVDRATEVGAKFRFGTTYTALDQDADGVDISFADGSTGHYDLVIGADGIRSWTRRMLGITLETHSTGMGIWRIFGPRPASINRTELYYGGPCYIAGYCPTGENSIYAYLVEDAQDRSTLSAAEQLDVARALATSYHGPWDEIRAEMTDASKVNYTWFETHVLPAPWNRGRVVLVGDAAHTCPPTLAQGAAQAFEDAAVLAELLLSHDSVSGALWDEFMARRFDRARAVVDASVQLGQWQLDRVRDGDVPGLMAGIARLVSDPA